MMDLFMFFCCCCSLDLFMFSLLFLSGLEYWCFCFLELFRFFLFYVDNLLLIWFLSRLGTIRLMLFLPVLSGGSS